MNLFSNMLKLIPGGYEWIFIILIRYSYTYQQDLSFINTIRLPNNLGLMTIHRLNFHEELNKFLILKANYMI
jgi:hypothetical protein